MSEKYKNIVLCALMAGVLLTLSLWAWLKPADAMSYSERRPLAQMPKLTGETVLSTKFMSGFDSYTVDQFPLRDSFRGLKALAETGLFHKSDSNGLYVVDGYVSKLEYPMNPALLDNGARHIGGIYDKYLAGTGSKVYFSVIPDKNYFMAEPNGYLSMDYAALVQTMTEGLPFAQYIDIMPLLSLEDYYRTDSHWRQEAICDVAQTLCEAMGAETADAYQVNTVSAPFYGVYYGQAALPLVPDKITYLTNGTLAGCTVTSYDTGMPVEIEMYDLEQLTAEDPYEMFLGGSDALLVIENPNARTDKELIVFRDSFGASLVPLMVEGYAKITLVDTRYINPAFLGNFVDFHGQDVLFIYSTMVLNNSSMFK